MAICWRRGVEPTRKPVFRSCDVLPAFAVATATTAAIEIACTRWSTPVHPMARKIRHVPKSAAMVMPEIGLADEPIWPQMREETVAKKNPKMTIRIAPSRLTPTCGRSVRTMARDRKSTRLNSSHLVISYAVFCLKKKKKAHGEVRATTTLIRQSTKLTTDAQTQATQAS